MEFFKSIVNVLTNPPILITAAMILFLHCGKSARILETASRKNSFRTRRRIHAHQYSRSKLQKNCCSTG